MIRLQRSLAALSWLSLVLTLVGAALIVILSPFSELDEAGMVHDHFSNAALAFGTFLAGVVGMVVTKILSPLLMWLARRNT